MNIDFVLRGIDGHVTVTYAQNDQPQLVGSGAESRGFPFCDATVDFPARGYDVQVTAKSSRSTHWRSLAMFRIPSAGLA